MSSIYSSIPVRASSFEPARQALHGSKSLPLTPAKSHHPHDFRTVPDSPRHNRLLSDDDGLDLEILTHKLQLYQLELEEAELRFKHKRIMEDKQAAEVAAAARFRDELNKLEQSKEDADLTKRQLPIRTSSLRKFDTTNIKSSPPMAQPTRTLRTKRPQPLLLADTHVEPQEVQSAALPTRPNRGSGMAAVDMKRHWRRTTISAGQHSKIVLLSSDGKPEYCDFDVVPPVPQLSASTSTATSPPSMSPMTPLTVEPTEDQIRRELETFALEEGPNIHLSRRSSAVSRRRMPAAFVPDAEDRLPVLEKRLPAPPPPIEIPSVSVEDLDRVDPYDPHAPGLSRKKSFFSRFEKKTDVDSVLDLYMTDQQLDEVKAQKKRATKVRRQTFFKRWQPADALFHKTERPG